MLFHFALLCQACIVYFAWNEQVVVQTRGKLQTQRRPSPGEAPNVCVLGQGEWVSTRELRKEIYDLEG